MKDEIFDLIKKEEERQEKTLMLIPSENYSSKEVREAVGSVLSHKYAEGYPGKRYYQGNSVADEVENIAIERAKELFRVPFANVQALSGSPANMAAYFALLNPGDKLMGMQLNSGGHLTHGHGVNFSGKIYNSVQYSVGEDGYLDYDLIAELARKEKPKMIVCGFTAYPRIIDFEKFAKIADEVGAYLLADISHIAGLVVGGVHPTPVPFVDIIMTTTHKTLRGPRGAIIMVTEKGLKKDPEMGKKIDKAIFPGLQGGPHLNTIAGIAVSLCEASESSFKTYAEQVVKNAKVLAESLTGMNPVTGGTDNHLIVLDLRKLGIDGKLAAEKLEESGIIVNKNTIPFDENKPLTPSGIRLGTPAVTTRGMKEGEMRIVGDLIKSVLIENKNVRLEVEELCKKFPMSS